MQFVRFSSIIVVKYGFVDSIPPPPGGKFLFHVIM